MLNKKLKLITALGCALGITAPASVFATNGMFLIGHGTKSRGMGGVGITMTHDSLTSATNPATLAYVKGNRFDIGGDIFIPKAEATLGQGNNKVTEESIPEYVTIKDGVYMMPSVGASWNDGGDISYGVTMVSVGGGGSQYNYNMFNSLLGGDTRNEMGVTLLVTNINPTIAYKLDDNNSIGATLIVGIQAFRAYGLEQFLQFTLSQDPNTAKFNDQGTDFSYGAGIRLGWLGKYMDGDLSLGAAYTSQTYMSRFDKYSDLFAEQGKINTPGNIGIGATYKALEDLSVSLDIAYIMYEDVPAISNPGPNTSTGSAFPVDVTTNALGADKGLGFGWENQTVYKLGLEYQYDTKITLRGGWNYGKSPIDSSKDILFNIVAPATTQNHLTLGLSYQLNKDMEISASYIHAFRNKQFGPTYIGYEGSIQMEQDALGAGFSMNF